MFNFSVGDRVTNKQGYEQPNLKISSVYPCACNKKGCGFYTIKLGNTLVDYFRDCLWHHWELVTEDYEVKETICV